MIAERADSSWVLLGDQDLYNALLTRHPTALHLLPIALNAQRPLISNCDAAHFDVASRAIVLHGNANFFRENNAANAFMLGLAETMVEHGEMRLILADGRSNAFWCNFIDRLKYNLPRIWN